MDDLLSEFLTETTENLATLDLELVHLERDPGRPGLIDNIFRLVHTIKGTCGFLGLPRLESVAHAAENILGKFRDRELVVTPEAVGLIFESLDRIKGLLATLEATEAEPAGDDGDLIARLDAMAEGGVRAAPAAPEPTNLDAGLGRALKPGEVSLEALEAAFQAASGPAAALQAAGSPDAGTAAAAALVSQPTAEPKREQTADSAIANQSIRVSVDLLENLMTMVSELVLTRNQLLQMVRGLDNSEFAVPLQRLSHVTTELQEGVMKTRMQPIGNAWAKLPRIIRDLSHELNKRIDLQMHGAETELDRQVLELIKDPLTHMVRNAADHGLEGPDERRKAGKAETGHITLNAFHEGGHIIIEIKDDGRGLNLARIKQKIVDNGLATQAEIDTMSVQQVQQFIFRAGFSTAAAVTSVSGRGVGMDVVRSNIEKIGGTIELKSEEGKGSAFTIKIPLTLAIVSALIVESAGERFAVPQISVTELVRVSPTSEQKVERINNAAFLRLRDRLLPLIFLDNLLKLTDTPPTVDSEKFIVVTQVGSHTFGIMVDRVFDTEEIVVKPVAPLLRNIDMFSGNTILGDGSVIMILDPNGVAAAAGVARTGESHVTQDDQPRAARSEDLVALLLFRAGGAEPKAVPLNLVARLEEVDVNQIEQVDGRQLVQYRGKLMPLIKLNDEYSLRGDGRQPVLVFADGDRSMGIIVEEIVDIAETEVDIQLGSKGAGILGSAVIAGQATAIIDVGYYVKQGHSDWFRNKANAAFGAGTGAKRVLLVDDSPFFRNMLAPLLAASGYSVTAADSADAALQRRAAGEQFDVIISDIEMPGMDGFAFASEVKNNDRWRETPIVALSSHTNPQDLERGRAAGFSDYVAKFDRAALLQTLDQTLAVHRGAA